MKKSIITLGAIVALYFGVLFYAGSQTKDSIQSYLDKTNRVYQEQGLNVSVKINKFNKNLLGADVEYSVQFDLTPFKELAKKAPKNLVEKFTKPFKFSQKIQFGPIFLDNGLEFGMAKFHHQGSLSELIDLITASLALRIDSPPGIMQASISKAFKESFKEDVLLSYNVILSLAGNSLNTQGSIGAIHFEKDNLSFQSKKISLDAITNIDEYTGNINIKIPSMSAKYKNNKVFLMQNFSLSAEINEFINSLYNFGQSVINIEKMVISDGYAFNVNLSSKAYRNSTHSALSDSDFKLNINSLSYPDKIKTFSSALPKKVQIGFNTRGINSMAIFQAYQAIQKINPGNIAKLKEHSLSFIKQVFTKGVSELNFSLNANFNKQPTVDNYLKINTMVNFDGKDIDTAIRLINNKPAFSKFIKDKLNIDILLKAASEHFILFAPMLKIPLQMNILVEKDGFYQAEIHHKNGQLTVNNKDLSQLINAF
jgi:hypothetical protein